MDKCTTKTVFNEYIHPLDKYAKKLDTLTFTKLFIYTQLQGLPSLRRISEKVKRKKAVQRVVGIDSISKSQLSRKLGDIPPASPSDLTQLDALIVQDKGALHVFD